MESILLIIKHQVKFLWKIIEWGNGLFFSLLFQSRLEKVLPKVFNEITKSQFSYRRLKLSDAGSLHKLFTSQQISDLEYFSPHDLDLNSIKRQFQHRSFLMMGVFDEEKMVGYFFLRYFVNKKCFVGRLIDKDYRGRGIGFVMNQIMYETAWRMSFRCLSTISRNNIAVMRAHAKNPTMVVIKELRNNYLLVEFERDAEKNKKLGVEIRK